MALPRAGEVLDGYRFRGGDPNDQNAWEPFEGGPKPGDIVDGFRFAGGDPNTEAAWKKDESKSLVSDMGRQVGSSFMGAVGGAERFVGRGLEEAGRPIAEALNSIFNTDTFRSASPLEPFAAASERSSKAIESNISTEGRRAREDTTPTGNVFTGEDLSFGKDPSLRGVAMQAASLFGSMAPQFVAAVMTRGASLPEQVVAGAGTGGATGAGAAMQQARETLDGMNDAKLYAESSAFRELVDGGLDSKAARERVTREAENFAGLITLPISALGGAATGAIIGKGAEKVVGGIGSRVGRAAALGGVSAAEEAIQETAEGVATIKGQNIGAGTATPLGEGSFGNLVLGALGGSGPGAARGAFTDGPGVIDSARRIMQADNVDDAIAAAEAALDTIPYEKPDVATVAGMKADNLTLGSPAPVGNEIDYTPPDPLAKATGIEDRLNAPAPPVQFDPAVQGQARPDDSLTREPAPLEAPALEIPGAPAAPQEIPPILLDNPPESPAIARTGVDPARGVREPAQMTAKELVMAAKLTRSDTRRAELSAEIERRAAPAQNAGNEQANSPDGVVSPARPAGTATPSQPVAAGSDSSVSAAPIGGDVRGSGERGADSPAGLSAAVGRGDPGGRVVQPAEVSRSAGVAPQDGVAGDGRADRAPAQAETVAPATASAVGKPEVPEPNDYASSQVKMPEDVTRRALTAAKTMIAPEDVADKGLEDRPHITVKYGLHTDSAEDLQKALSREGAGRATFGPIKIFRPEGKEYDVVVQSVESPDLHRLNAKVGDSLEHTDTFPTYEPHMTLGYVKKGVGAKYENAKSGLEGTAVDFDRVEFSSRDETVTPVKLGAAPKPAKTTIRQPGIPAENGERQLTELREYAQRVAKSGSVRSVRLVGSSVNSSAPNDTDILYEFAPGIETEEQAEAAIEASGIELDRFDTFIKSGDRYFHVSSGAGRAVVANDAYAREQAGKPTIELASAERRTDSNARLTAAADAVARGEKVSPEVLAEYPKLAELAKAKEAFAARGRTEAAAPAKEAPAPAWVSASGVKEPPKLKQAEPGKGMPATEARKTLAPVIARSRVPIRVVQSVEELRKEDGFEETPDDSRGGYHQGRIFVVADNVSDPLDLERTVARHEFTHAGYDRLYGDNKTARVDALRALQRKNPKLRERAIAWRVRYGRQFVEKLVADGEKPQEAEREMVLRSMEESVAYFSEELTALKGWRAFAAIIQRGLRRMGLTRLADFLESATDAEAAAEIARVLQVVEIEPETAPVGAEAEPAFARRIFQGDVRRVHDFVLPETPEYDGNMTGDLAVITKEAAKSHQRIESLPIRLPVGVVKGAHQGFGLMHMKAEAVADPKRRPRNATPSEAENFTREVAEIAQHGTRLYYDTDTDRVILQGKAGFGLVLEARSRGEADRFYSVVTMFKPREATFWGRPVWVERVQHTTTEPPQSVAPELSPGQTPQQPDRQSLGVQTEHFEFNPDGSGTQGPDRTPPKMAGDLKLAAKTAKAPDWIESGPEALRSAAAKIDTYAPGKSMKEKVRELAGNWRERAVQGLFDAFAPLKRLGPTEYVKARMVKSADGALEGLLLYGKPKMGEDGAIYGDIDKKGFLGAMRELQGEHDRFFMWVAGNRAERLMGEDREHLFTKDEIRAMKALAGGKMRDGAPRPQAYERAAATLRDYNKAVLDIAERTGLIDGESRHLWEHDFYVPFFRVDDDMKIEGPAMKVKGLVRQQAFKKLTGGEENLGDLLDNTLRNWSHLLSASMANQAAVASLKAAVRVGVATEVPEGTKGATYAMVAGQKVHYEVSDPFILTAISAMESASFKGLPMAVMSKFKHYLTLGVTVSPTFRVRNLMRDSISAIGQNEMNYNVMSNLARGFKGTDRKSDAYAQMLFNGALMRFGQLTDGKHAEHAKRLIAAGVDESTILTGPEKAKAALGKLWDAWQEFGDKMENVNRTALYAQMKAEGKSDLEAAFAARDMLDFSLQGSWTAVRFLTQIVPFMNARLQGLYKLGRAGHENPARLGYVAGAVALASIALMLAYQDDEEWKKREDWDRDNFWWFKVGDVAFRIPKPFEIGAIGTLAERSVELMLSDEMTGKRFGQRLRAMVGETLALNPTPQLFKPMIDLYANVDSFSGRQIETRGMENLSKSERMTPYTSLVARILGKAGGATNLSPVQVDHLIRSYFGWLGSHVAMTVDLMAQPFMDVEKPARKLGDYFVIGDFAKDLPSDRSRYVEQFFKQAKEVHEVMGDLKHAREARDLDRVREILAEKKADLALSKLYSGAEHRMGEINKQIRMVHASRGSAEEKREKLDRLTAMRNELARTVEMRATRARAAAGP